MEKIDAFIENIGDEIKDKQYLFAYDENEQQNIIIAKENAKLVFKQKYLVIPSKLFRLDLTSAEVLILAFVQSYTVQLPEKQRFYFTNKQISEYLGISEATVSRTVIKLNKAGLISASYRIKAGGGKIRFIIVPPNKNERRLLKESFGTDTNTISATNQNDA